MADKSKVNLRRYIPGKMKKGYWIKFVLYVIVLLALFFWYKKQVSVNERNTKILKKQKMKQKEIVLDRFEIESNLELEVEP